MPKKQPDIVKEIDKKNKVIDLIKSARDVKSLEAIMADIEVPRTKENLFKDTMWNVETSKKKEFKEVHFKGLNSAYTSILKAYYVMKVYGHLDGPLSNSKQWLVKQKSLMQKLQNEKPTMKAMAQISMSDIETIIGEWEETANATSIYRALALFREILDAEKSLPAFMQLMPSILEGDLYANVKEAYGNKKQKRDSGTPKPTKNANYPFEHSKILIPKAFELIEEGEAILDLMEHLTKVGFFDKENLSNRQRYGLGVKMLRGSDFRSNDPELDRILSEIQSGMSSHIGEKQEDGTYKCKGSRWTLIAPIEERIALLESACLIVYLLFSADRRQHLADMSREFDVGNYSDLQLVKNKIFKTAATRAGEPHEFPMPEIGIKAMHLLARLARIRDGQASGRLISFSQRIAKTKADRTTSDPSWENRINNIVEKLPKKLGLQNITPHQLRHMMAYMLLNVLGTNGENIELIRYMLGHSSALMTMTYISRYNPEFADAMAEIIKEKSKEELEMLRLSAMEGKEVYGARAMEFHGRVREDMEVLFEYIADGIAEGSKMIIATPLCICFHDVLEPGEMKCQRGLKPDELTGILPQINRCEPGGCSSALYLDSHIEKLMRTFKQAAEELGELDIFKHICENTYINPDDYLADMEAPYEDVIAEYIKNKEKKAG